MHICISLALVAASTAAAHARLGRRDVTWGPIIGFQETSSEIISTTSTMYPGKMPSDQKGYMFAWIGVGVNGDGYDLIQSIVGSYPTGLSECSGTDADSTWCVSSEVYGLDSSGTTTQFVGEETTADANYENGIVFNYTLTDISTYSWTQTMNDAATGELLSTYTKVSKQKSTLWNTAIEIQDYNGAEGSGTVEPQYYVNTTIVLKAADKDYGSTIYAESGGVYTEPTTSDGGKTWFIEKITVPAMSS
ncbi:hypothetical protein BKA67DRAFT_652906 [Truncatella angustata]|uniref:Uncharacterized protein n=1 Tax=Truncatella angustata TaxID=152316 RepID=A0A9P8UW77_9PEZI|nr:uncharacterized protein BKA67DRAFT_652906 [Truncatella angustata]KAH6659681.1 hypothetical protein BKA67DRAFT_652906 [Truncatella angustata]KAH8195784.1 hypothetical protein TruAng_010058 [Truncatella angustata]